MATTETQTARKALRAATAAHHDRVDAAFSRFRLDDRDDYGAFLTAQAAAFAAVEPALQAGGIAELVPDWAARKRLEALKCDLSNLGISMPEPSGAPDLSGAAELLGGLYVLEGSRLGGALLRRSVPDSFPSSFLTAGDPALWRKLIDLLDARLRTAEEIEAATKGAERVFSVFEQAGLRKLAETTTSG